MREEWALVGAAAALAAALVAVDWGRVRAAAGVGRWIARAEASRGRKSAEKGKMLEGELYLPDDTVLRTERGVAHDGCALFNKLTLAEDEELRERVFRELVGEAGAGARIEPPFQCDYGYNIRLGPGVFMNFGCVVLDCAVVSIGKDTLFGPNCMLVTPNHPMSAKQRTAKGFPEKSLPITIGARCWFGAGAVVCPGVTIGDDVVVAAGAVVTKDVPAGVMVAGVPATVRKQLPVDE